MPVNDLLRRQLEKELAAEEHNILRGEQHVARQWQIVKDQHARGEGSKLSEDLLRNFETALQFHRRHAEQIRERLRVLSNV